ncbi:hypothetical protein B2H99_02025 [Morganella morganii]|nr:hypothetical protein B2I00_16225 [Morganella morganii]OQP28691.1 hypothetical protein B2H99_02025 [Morganella morganii]
MFTPFCFPLHHLTINIRETDYWSSVMANLKITVVCLVALSPLLFLSDALAKNCKKGIPCGNSCISANKVCRIGTANSYSTKNYSNKSISTNSKKSLHGSTVAATGGVSAASLAGRSSGSGGSIGSGVAYNCIYSKVVIVGDAMGPMQGRFHSTVSLSNSAFTAFRPDGSKISSPKMKTKKNGYYFEQDDKTVYVMSVDYKEYAVSDFKTKTTEQWAECQ